MRPDVSLLHPGTEMHHIKSRALGQKATVSTQNPDLQVETQGHFSVPLLPAYKMGMEAVLISWSQDNFKHRTVTVLCDAVIKYKLALLQSRFCFPLF